MKRVTRTPGAASTSSSSSKRLPGGRGAWPARWRRRSGRSPVARRAPPRAARRAQCPSRPGSGRGRRRAGAGRACPLEAPGDRAGQLFLGEGAEERLAGGLKLVQRLRERRDAVRADEVGLDPVGAALELEELGRRRGRRCRGGGAFTRPLRPSAGGGPAGPAGRARRRRAPAATRSGSRARARSGSDPAESSRRFRACTSSQRRSSRSRMASSWRSPAAGAARARLDLSPGYGRGGARSRRRPRRRPCR